MNYYIINLVATRQEQQLIFVGRGYRQDSIDPTQALVVREDLLNKSLERFDNGRTTRAILIEKFESHTGHWRELVGWVTSEQKKGAVA